MLLCGLLAQAATQHIALRDGKPHSMSSSAGMLAYLNADKASIGGPSDARELIGAAIDGHYFAGDRKKHWTRADLNSPAFYCIIHVVRWKDTPSDTDKDPIQKVDVQNWYVYNGDGKWAQDDFTTNKRIFGAKNVGLLYIHLHRSARLTTYSVEYDLDVTSKTPANVIHLFQAAGAFLPATQNAPATQDHDNVFGFADANISYVPSDISAIGNISMNAGELQVLGDSIVLDNEGKYYWDVSVAVPIRKMSQLEFNDTNNTVTSRSTDKRNVFAVLDLYPFKKDVKNTSFDWHPYGLVGIGISQQPLHKILVAGGWGPRFAQFYAGVLFSKQQTLNSLTVGSVATPGQLAADTNIKFKPQFAFGINLPVRDVFQAATRKDKTPK
jgi:hypothetical protein